MAQQFLYDLGILAVRIQERPKKCAERCALRHLRTLQSRLAVISPQRSGPIRLSAFHVRRSEYPVAWTGVRRKVSPGPQQLGRLRIQRNVFHRRFRFRRTFRHRHYRPTNVLDRFSKSTSCHGSPIRSPRRNPVKASNSIILRSGSGSSLRNAMISLSQAPSANPSGFLAHQQFSPALLHASFVCSQNSTRA